MSKNNLIKNIILKIFYLAFLLILLSFSQQKNYDIVIYGATPSGFVAAIESARLGKSVALLEPSQHLGGIITNGLGGTDVDNHGEFQNSLAVGGLALEFYKRIAKIYDREKEFNDALKNKTKNTSLWRFESKVAEQVINDWIKEYDIDVFFGQRLAESKSAVKKKQAKILEIRMENNNTFKGKMFIDASLEGDLLARAKISTTRGRESNSKYNETLNGIRKETTHAQFKVKVDPYKEIRKPKSGLIPTIQNEPLGTPGGSDKSIQAFCFRMCLTQNKDNQVPFSKPQDYDRSQYEIYFRYLKAGGKLYTPRVSIPNGKTDLGAWHDLSHNLYGMNHDYPTGNYATREKILKEHQTFTQGLFYFLANDEEVGKLDPDLQKTWASWGLAKDEFTDNNHWPREFYVRDARRMVSDYVITEYHTRKANPKVVEEPVAVAFWPPDLHSARRIVKDGFAYNEGFVFGGDTWRPFGISYRALIPKEKECTNLLTPTCPSSSHIAYGAIRIEFTYMALGQACAAMASQAIDNSVNIQQIDYKSLINVLDQEGQVYDSKKVGVDF